MTDTLAQDLTRALSELSEGGPLRAGATALLNTLGYSSQRTVDAGSVEEFLERFAPGDTLTEKRRELFKPWTAVEVVFQFTATEMVEQSALFQTSSFEKGRNESFLFLAVDMAEGTWTRTRLAETTRVVNRLFKMPVILLFRYGPTLTLAAIHRRADKRDDNRDVLEKVSLVKDIRAGAPHRAHIDILSDLSFQRMLESGVRGFDGLHGMWEKTLDIEALNRRFYADLFKWFQWAVAQSHFPNDNAGEGSGERHAIRLITRILFIWFMKEKGLVPGELFEEDFARSALKNHAQDKTDYYRAVLQNLFFATLNTEMDKRAFSKVRRSTHRDFTKYRYRRLLVDPDNFLEKLKKVPFVNGGLFDCLDDFAARGAGGQRVDAFTDNPDQGRGLNVPARLFFDPQDGLFPLLTRYKFTVEENTPLDQEVALDPELLGRVFENLLATYNPETRETARKSTGSYYTPRQVVNYMVHEALTEALVAKTDPADGDAMRWRDRLHYLLDHSDAMNDADVLFKENDRHAVVAAIADIQALDPAAGSGAFPMGILQTLTLALRRIDPDNRLWEQFQKDRAKDRAGAAFDLIDQQQRDDVLGEISDTFQRYRQSDFGRKLYLIQNSIYGVDVQPIACQIAKLRFFISLVIEQNPDPSASNLGIKPLPNLETRFVAADTLTKLRAEAKSLLVYDVVEAKRKEILAVRERYFLADSRSKKIKYVEDEQRLRDELRRTVESEHAKRIAAHERDLEQKAAGFSDPETRARFLKAERPKLEKLKRKYSDALADARKIAQWRPYDQNAVADWFDAKYMFGASDGFDVVTGNPPYIQLQKNAGQTGKDYTHAGYEIFAKTGNIYQLFYERGCRLLKSDKGVLAYITSNSWLKAQYGKPLRRWFTYNHTPLSLMELGTDVFENARVHPAILIVRHGKDNPVACSAVAVDQISDDKFPPPHKNWLPLQSDDDRPWTTLSPVERSVMKKMEACGKPLKNWDISIYRGILTGRNEAFVVDQRTRDDLVAADPRSADILKPILRGRDIARYRANWADLWLISTFPSLGLDIDAYPAVKKHLLSFGSERLAQEGRRLPKGGQSRKKTPHAWYELQDTCAYHEEFQKEKPLRIEFAEQEHFS